MATALRRGYATASTDTGHTGDDVKFGQGHPEKVIDYGWRAIHIMTDTAKLVVRNAQGRFPDKSYFVGCSAGGHQAMSEAQRFPDDYDGIIAGAPASNRIRQTFGFMHSWLATHNADGSPDPHRRQAGTGHQGGGRRLRRGRHAQGRADRGPAQVRASTPATLACKPGGDDATCLTPPQVEAVKKVHEGAKNPRTGEQIFTGWPRGSEAFGETADPELAPIHHRHEGTVTRRRVQVLAVQRSELGRAHARLRSRLCLSRTSGCPTCTRSIRISRPSRRAAAS